MTLDDNQKNTISDAETAKNSRPADADTDAAKSVNHTNNPNNVSKPVKSAPDGTKFEINPDSGHGSDGAAPKNR